MHIIHPCPLPPEALLGKYAHAGVFTDCYVTEVAGNISQARYVEAFYTTALFKIERILLRWLVARPSTDIQVQQLATGTVSTFAAWIVEIRTDNQLLLTDVSGRTRSWLMSTSPTGESGGTTRLYFGSAVVPRGLPRSGGPKLDLAFRALRAFHALYSRALLYAARSRLVRAQRKRS
jgi:hypothetical protein